MTDPRELLELHRITEKSNLLRETTNSYVFQVKRKATKPEIKKAVEKAFNVKVDTVRTMIMPAKPKRLGRFAGRTTAWKKAIVTLAKGQHITDFDNV